MRRLAWWEQQHLVHTDVVIVGAGLVGLTAAWGVARARPRWRVRVVERGVLPTGASTRNAGFACFGSPTELLEDEARIGLDATVALVARRRDGLRRLRARLGDEALGFRATGGFELLDDPSVLEAVPRLDAALSGVFEGRVFVDATDRLPSQGFGPAVRALVALPHEGALDPGAMMRALSARARSAGVEVLTGAEVVALEPHDGGVRIVLEGLTLHAEQVAVCTNGLAAQLLDLPITPARNQVLLTAPLPDLPFDGVFHRHGGSEYFRRVGDRVLLGGARHLDPEAEAVGTLGLHPGIRAHLDEVLHRVVLPGRGPIPITHRWSGLLGLGPTREPTVARLQDRVVVGAGLGGMGVALGTEVGESVADLLLDRAGSASP